MFCKGEKADVTLRVQGYHFKAKDGLDAYSAAQALADGMDFAAVFEAENIEQMRAAAHYK